VETDFAVSCRETDRHHPGIDARTLARDSDMGFTESVKERDQEKNSSFVKIEWKESRPGRVLSIASAIRNEMTRGIIEF